MRPTTDTTSGKATRRSQVWVAGELAARRELVDRGHRVVAANARTRYGEIDLITLDGSCLVFVEVKALRGSGQAVAERALESVTPHKQQQVRKLARNWLAENGRAPGRYSEIRFDAVGVAVGPGGPDAVAHIEAAF